VCISNGEGQYGMRAFGEGNWMQNPGPLLMTKGAITAIGLVLAGAARNKRQSNLMWHDLAAVQVWDAESGELVSELVGHAQVTSLAFYASAEGRSRLVVGSRGDGGVRHALFPIWVPR
jgi:hypothetical protein